MLLIFLFWMLFAIVFALAIGAIYLIVSIINKAANKRKTSLRPYIIVWATLSITWLGIMVYGHLIGRWELEVKNYDLNLPPDQLPEAFDGYKIVHFSDLHLDGWQNNPEKLENLVSQINKSNADIVCFTGDIVSYDYHELETMMPILSRVYARSGVYSILGNHDYAYFRHGISDEQRQALTDTLIMKQQEMGWRVLLNENLQLHKGNDSIALAGSENQSYGLGRRIQSGDIKKTLDGISEEEFTILLTHDPSQWGHDIKDSTAVDLTLAGHTHAWQINICGFTPAEFLFSESSGWYHYNRQHIYVSVGLGGTLRFRVGATPEIAVITLRRLK